MQNKPGKINKLPILKQLSLMNFVVLSIAGIVNAIGVTIFIAPVQLYDSGISGTSILLSQLTPDALSLSVFLLILNIPLFLYGLRKQGAVFTIYAIYAVSIYALTAWLITDILPIDVSVASPLAGTDLFLCAIFGGIYIIRNFRGKMSVLNITGWVLCFVGVMAILAEIIRFFKEKKEMQYEILG